MLLEDARDFLINKLVLPKVITIDSPGFIISKTQSIFGSSNVKRLTYSPGMDGTASFSPDGKKIVFHSIRDGSLNVYTMNLDGSKQINLTNNPGSSELWTSLCKEWLK